jgi:peptidoglycan hydrolase CwlO-like protein
MSDAIHGAAAIALAGAIATVAYKVYKAKFSKAAKACVQYKGIEKQECMLKFKKQALQTKVQVLQKGASKLCAKNKNPGECRARIQAKIAETNKQMQSK